MYVRVVIQFCSVQLRKVLLANVIVKCKIYRKVYRIVIIFLAYINIT